jgi:hypothetical protein
MKMVQTWAFKPCVTSTSVSSRLYWVQEAHVNINCIPTARISRSPSRVLPAVKVRLTLAGSLPRLFADDICGI